VKNRESECGSGAPGRGGADQAD